MRVRHGARVRAAVSSTARGVAGPWKGSKDRSQPGCSGKGGLWSLARAPW